MDYIQEPTVENETCKRCGRKTRILSNGLCPRCDDVLYGHKQENSSPWIPMPKRYIPQIPSNPEHPPKRKQYWCLVEKI